MWTKSFSEIRNEIISFGQTTIVKRLFIAFIIAVIIFAISLDYWGMEELDKSFNKWSYDTYYYVNIYHDSMELFERAPAYISVSNGIFSRNIFVKSISLDSVNFNFNFNFSDGERDEELFVGKPIPFYFSEDNEADYKIYIELTLSKVPIKKEGNITTIEPDKKRTTEKSKDAATIKRDIRPHRVLK